jgi:hypothetical protein
MGPTRPVTRYYDILALRLTQFTASRAVSSLSSRPGGPRPVTRGRVRGLVPRPGELTIATPVRVRFDERSSVDSPIITPLPRNIHVKRAGLHARPRVEVEDIPTIVDRKADS